MPFLIAYPETLIEYATLEEAYSKALTLAHKMEKIVGVYEIAAVRACAPLPTVIPPTPTRTA